MEDYQPTLGTLMRTLLERLDGSVEAAYRQRGLDFRPRFTSIVRVLSADGPLRIKALAARTGLSHSATSQTLSEMRRSGLVILEPGKDGRERLVSLSDKATAVLPMLQEQWSATARAAASLNAEIGVDLELVMRAALDALDRQDFSARMADE